MIFKLNKHSTISVVLIKRNVDVVVDHELSQKFSRHHIVSAIDVDENRKTFDKGTSVGLTPENFMRG